MMRPNDPLICGPNEAASRHADSFTLHREATLTDFLVVREVVVISVVFTLLLYNYRGSWIKSS